MSLQANLVKLREEPETARAGLKWSDEEDKLLMNQAFSKLSLKEIAKDHQRTISSIKSRILLHAMEYLDKKSLEEVSEMINLPVEEIVMFQEKRSKRQLTKLPSQNTNLTSDDKYMPILVEIRDLLKQLVNHMT